MECDIQVKLAKHIKGYEAVALNAARLAQVAKIMNIPVIATEQKNFGAIDPLITAHHHEGVKHFVKSTFSMLDGNVLPYFESLKRNQVVLYGAETHVCVKQTALDLLERNYDVHLVVDAVSSMNYHDRNIGLESMRDAGVTITSF